MKSIIKYQVIFKHRDKYIICQMCNFFKVSRSEYLKLNDKPARDLPLTEKIRKSQEQTPQTYGFCKIKISLEKQGIYSNQKTILQVMQKYNLLSKMRRKKYKYVSEHLHKYPNMLNRVFTADKPNQKWVTDILYIPTKEYIYYLSVMRDLYDNSFVAYQISKDMRIKLVIDTINQQ